MFAEEGVFVRGEREGGFGEREGKASNVACLTIWPYEELM